MNDKKTDLSNQQRCKFCDLPIPYEKRYNNFCSLQCLGKYKSLIKYKEWEKSKTYCKSCNALIPFSKRDNIFCNSACAAKYNTTGRKHTKETKEKISTKIKMSPSFQTFVKNTRHENKKRQIGIECPVCHNIFYVSPYESQKIFCSKSCHIKDQQNSFKHCKKPSYKRNHGSNSKKGRYKGIWCESSYELAWVIYNLDHNINFKRNSKSFEYEFEEKTYNYYPDFISNGKYIEIKGYISDRDLAKFSQFPKNETLIILLGDDLKYCFDYISSTYGKEPEYLYEEPLKDYKPKKCLFCNNPCKVKYCSSSCCTKHAWQKRKQKTISGEGGGI